MKLIFGLGNPDEKYKKTRHNIGFVILDKIAEKLSFDFKTDQKFQAEIGEKDENRFVKPQTYMNESGRTVSGLRNYFKINPTDIWVIHDDVDLEFGKVRVAFGGSSAGHKGVQSIIDKAGESFWRIRVGIGKSQETPTDIWVLRDFEKKDQERLDFIVDNTADLMIEFLSSEIREQTVNFKNY